MSVEIRVMTIPGAPLEGLNPLPIFHNKQEINVNTHPDFPDALKVDLGARSPVLPYRMQDRYSRKRLPMKMKTIIMENEYLRAVFWPESGGRLYSLFDKVNQCELLMANPVYQPGNLAIRNAWLSGGIEWNFGTLGHHYFTCDHLFAAVLRDENGEEFVRMYEYERNKCAVYQIDFHLPSGSKVLYSHVKLFNPFDEDTTTYWWTNIAIPEDGGTRVLSSSERVVVLSHEGISYEKVPDIALFPGKDLSYPHNASRGFDYFYQAEDGVRSAWEAGAYSDGMVFFDRATSPLVYRKMFCWGNHSAGKHWQEYLSDPDKGYYVEIQGGFARSQLHDKLFPGRSTIEWTQCFGGMKLDQASLHDCSFAEANAYLEGHIENTIAENALFETDRRFASLANMPVTEADLVHTGSGWGALEALRCEMQGDHALPDSVCFPRSTIGPEQYPWYALLVEGVLPAESPDVIPPSWMVAPKWMRLLEESLNRENGETWYSRMHYGVMLNEMMDRGHVAWEASRWGRYGEYRARAREAFERSLELEPSVWALRCLFCIADEEGDDALAEKYYDRVFELDAATVDYAFASEYMGWLNRKGKYQKAWDLYQSMPEPIRQQERMILHAALTAVRLRNLDYLRDVVFVRSEFACIREGETALTDIWFEYSALKLAAARGIENPQGEILDKLIDEAWDICPPPAEIDFRMSFDRASNYRVEN